ncbi:MAG: VLRF1 family aeRF1-type release factor [Candidatus Acidiferrum sp.]
MLHMKEIQAIAASPAPILSVYVNTQNRNASRHPRLPEHLAWLVAEARSLSPTVLPADAKRFGQELDRVKKFLEGRHPEETALAIFAGPQTWAVIPLQTTIHHEMRWGQPAVGQLFRLLSEHDPYGIVVVDHHSARFFRLHLGELTQLDETRYDIDESQWKRTDVGHIASERNRKAHGSDRDLYEHRLKAQFEHRCRETADRALALSKEHGFAGLFLTGPEPLLASLRAKFPPAARVVPVQEDLGGFSPKEIRQRLEPLVATDERKRQIAEVEQLLSAPNGTVIDTDEALARLQKGTIRILVVAADRDFHVRECAKCGALNRSSDLQCPDCGGERRNLALFDILPRLAATYGTAVQFVNGEAAKKLAVAGGIGGWVRQPARSAAG